MNWEQIEGKWDMFKGMVREKWGKLTDNDLTTIRGKRDQLIGKLRERYGFAKDRAEDEIDQFLDSCGCAGEDEDIRADSRRANPSEPRTR